MSTGFLVVDKPGGMTSNAVVSRVKRATGIKKVGHAGTLDPLATGVVVVAIGPVTRLIRFIQEQPKEYQATAQFGVSTDTLDADGAVLSREPMEFSPEELDAIAARFVGTILQVPPMISALKHEGRRLYEMARQGVRYPVQFYGNVVHDTDASGRWAWGGRARCGRGSRCGRCATASATAPSTSPGSGTTISRSRARKSPDSQMGPTTSTWRRSRSSGIRRTAGSTR